MSLSKLLASTTVHATESHNLIMCWVKEYIYLFLLKVSLGAGLSQIKYSESWKNRLSFESYCLHTHPVLLKIWPNFFSLQLSKLILQLCDQTLLLYIWVSWDQILCRASWIQVLQSCPWGGLGAGDGVLQGQGQSRALTSPRWEERQMLWSSSSLLPMISLLKFESVGSYINGNQQSFPSQGHQTHTESMWATLAAIIVSRPHLPLKMCSKPLVIVVEIVSIEKKHGWW